MVKELFYYDEKDGQRVTFAGIMKDDNTLSIGAAICSKKDIFVKKQGRSKALGRAKSNSPLTTVETNEFNGRMFVSTCRNIINSPIDLKQRINELK